MNKDNLKTPLIIVAIGAIIATMGIVISLSSTDSVAPQEPQDEVSTLEAQIADYQEALSVANERIDEVNGCVDSAEDNVDYGLDSVLDELCKVDNVSDPHQ